MKSLLSIMVPAGCLLVTAACTGPRAVELPASVAPSPTPREWRAEITETGGTALSIHMTVLFREGGRWETYSRPGAALEMIPWWQRVTGRVLRKLPPHGALVSLDSGTSRVEGDSVVLRGKIESPFLGTRYLVGSMKRGRIQAELHFSSDTGQVAAKFDAVPLTGPGPDRDYRAIAANVRQTITDLIFDASLPSSPRFQAFFRDFARSAERARDDLDMVAGFFALRGEIGTSHIEFIRNPKIAATPLDSLIAGDAAVDPASFVSVGFYGRGLALLWVRRWDRVGPAIDKAFARFDSAKSSVLIIDIRGNPGGDATSMAPLTHLLRDTTPVGVLVGRKWFDAHDRPPSAADYGAFPMMSDAEEAKQLLNFVKDRGGAVGRVLPQAPYFSGKVFLLTNGGTGSASEPLAHILKITHRATIIGERTAGAMLTALPHPVGDGFILTVPEADYYAADGVRLEGRGVEPDIPTSSADALIVVGEEVRKILPYGAAIWLGGSFDVLKRYDESERAWRDALALAPTDAAKKTIEARIEAVRKKR